MHDETSQSRGQNFHSRRSEPCLRRQSPFRTAPTSEEEEEDASYARAFNPPLLTAMQSVCLTRERLPPPSSTSVCCTCCERCRGPRSSKRFTTVNHKKLCVQPRQLRETLRVHLIRIQVEEAAMDDERTRPIRHLSLIANAFEAFVQHVQSLEVSHLAADRVLDASRALLAYHEPPSNADCIDKDFTSHRRQIEIEKSKRVSCLRELTERCSTNAVLPKNVRTLLDAHEDRRRDFFLASANFKSLLESSKLSVSQTERLRRQYDDILKDLQQSRRLLDAELPRIINLRLEVLQQVFHEVSELYSNVDCNVRIVSIFKLIATNLHQTALDAGKIAYHEQEMNKELCQKCKGNNMDKK